MLGQIVNNNGTLEIRNLAGSSSDGMPIGSILALHDNRVPYGFLPCNGGEFDTTLYPALYTLLRTNKLPDLREMNLVGIGTNATANIATHDVYTLGQFKDDQAQEIVTGVDLTDPGHCHCNKAHQCANIGLCGSAGSRYDLTCGCYCGWIGDTAACTTGITAALTCSNTARTGATTHGKNYGVFYVIKAVTGAVDIDDAQIFAEVQAFLEDNYTKTNFTNFVNGAIAKWDAQNNEWVPISYPTISGLSLTSNVSTTTIHDYYYTIDSASYFGPDLTAKALPSGTPTTEAVVDTDIVYYNEVFYKYDSGDWKIVTDFLPSGAEATVTVTDSDLIDALDAETKSNLTMLDFAESTNSYDYCWQNGVDIEQYQPNDRLPVVRMVGVNCVNGCLVCFGNDDEGLLYCGSNTAIKSKNTTLNCCHSLAVNVNGIVGTACNTSAPSQYTQTCQTRSAIIDSAQDGSACVSDRKDTLYGVTTCVQNCLNNCCCQKTIHQQRICCICDSVIDRLGCETAGLELSNAKVCAHTANNYVQVTNNAITNVTGDNVCKVARTSLASNCSSKEVYNTDNDCCKAGHFTNDFAANDYSATQSNDYTYFCDDCAHREAQMGVATSAQKVCTNNFAHLYGCWNDLGDVFTKGVCVKRDGVHIYMDDTTDRPTSADWKITDRICSYLSDQGSSSSSSANVCIGQCINHYSEASDEESSWSVDNCVVLNNRGLANCITKCLSDYNGCKFCSGIIQNSASVNTYAYDVCGAGNAVISNCVKSTNNRCAYNILEADADGSCICSNANADCCALIQQTVMSGVYGATICQLAECSTGTSCIGMNASEVDITAGCINLNGTVNLQCACINCSTITNSTLCNINSCNFCACCLCVCYLTFI